MRHPVCPKAKPAKEATKLCSSIASAKGSKQHVTPGDPAAEPRTSKRPAKALSGGTGYDRALETRIAALEERLDSTAARAENQEVVILYLVFGSFFFLLNSPSGPALLLIFLFLAGGSPGWAQFCLGVAKLPVELVLNWPYSTM